MKMTPEELGQWISENPTLHSAKINGDVETILNEARHKLKDDSITVEDVRATEQAWATKVTGKVAAARAEAEGKAV